MVITARNSALTRKIAANSGTSPQTDQGLPPKRLTGFHDDADFWR
jgi:hypothetical protein